MSRWISVEERLPDEFTIVRAWDDHWKTSYDCLYMEGKNHSGKHETYTDSATGSWDAAVDREPDYIITHWMPLPEPPTVEQAYRQKEEKHE